MDVPNAVKATNAYLAIVPQVYAVTIVPTVTAVTVLIVDRLFSKWCYFMV